MKTTILKTTLTALAITFLSQPLSASEEIYSNNCFLINSDEAITIDVTKFMHVWSKLHNDKNDTSSKQQHLQKYLEKALEEGKERLDVAEFAALWEKAGNRSGEDHLTKKMADMVEKTKTDDECYQATDERKETPKEK
ncbi:MAG TPA: hypothetical protein ENK82_04720 [Campylobacterales bacterium]|nr:hypothetical protein [Campylobacterales bacterium]